MVLSHIIFQVLLNSSLHYILFLDLKIARNQKAQRLYICVIEYLENFQSHMSIQNYTSVSSLALYLYTLRDMALDKHLMDLLTNKAKPYPLTFGGE